MGNTIHIGFQFLKGAFVTSIWSQSFQKMLLNTRVRCKLFN